MVQIRYNNLRPLAQTRLKSKADQTQERSRIQAEGNLAGRLGIQEHRYRFARTGDRGVDRAALLVASAALNVMHYQVIVDGIQNHLRDLRAGGIIEKYESLTPFQGRKALSKFLNAQ
jgi:hypothetical protein